MEWLKAGDANTKYFHSKVTQRKRKNSLLGIEDDDGRWKDKNEEITTIIEQYFSDIFTSRNPTQEEMDQVLQNVPLRVNEEMNLE